jgi:hypothetical protein
MKKKLDPAKLPIYEIDISGDEDLGIELISIVDRPAIMTKGIMLNDDSYTDYPKAASENAKIALRWVEENGWGDCGTQVGKIRANQLANGEAISRDTIARMAAFERHRQNSDKKLGDGCGRLMWLSWGGDEGIEWAQRKLKQIDSELEYSKYKFEIVEEGDEQIIVGPALIPDIDIFQNINRYGPHFIRFTKDTIKKLVERFNSKGDNRRINIDHTNQIVNGFILEDWIVEDSLYDKSRMYGFKLPIGTYMLKVKIEDKDFWLNEVKGNEKFGFSIEGFLGQKLIKLESQEDISIDDLDLEDLIKIFLK